MMSARMSSAARHDKLRMLQKREAAKTRMGRLQTILQQKLIQKYGTTKNPNFRLNAEIREEVKTFTSRASCPLSDDKFIELENSIRELRAKYGRTGSAPSREDGRENTTMSERSGGDLGQNSTTGRLASAGGAGDDDGDDEEETLPPSIARTWRTFDVAKQIELEAKEKERLNKARQEKIRFQEELGIYRSQKERRKAEEEMERRKQVEETEKKLAEFRLEQDAMKRRAAERHAEDESLRQKQIRSQQEEKDKEKKAQLDRERQEIEQCKQQLQAEKTEMERKRMEEKKRLALIKEESVRQKEMRAQKQREMNELDAKMIRDHVRMLDEEERKRAKDIRDRMKRYEEIGDFWKNRGAGKRDAEIEAREEQQTLEAARRKEEADLERERQAAVKRRLAMIAMTTDNQKVIADKNAMKAKLRQEDMEFAQRFLNDSEAFMKEERDKLAKKRDTTERYRRDLAKQVEEAKARRIEDEMTDTEFMLNRDIVKKLEADKKLVAQIRRRMESAP